MKTIERALWLTVACLAALMGYGYAQNRAPAPPDPTHVSFVLAKDMKWEGDPAGGQVHVNLVGDPAKPGLYIRLAKWRAGNYSRPHFHDIERYFYVVSGGWWVSSSKTFDPATTYPMTTGTFVTHHANTVHFDGADKKEDGVILEIGVGPMKTTSCQTPTNCP
jgi:quercetin dioxygenase-like cupin family protein